MFCLYLLLILSSVLSCNTPFPDAGDTADRNMSGPEVQVKTDKKSYGLQEKIVVTLNHQLKQGITTMNQHTYCSIILLERAQDDNWQAIRNCTDNSPALEVTLPADSLITIVLLPHQHAAESLPAGIYRATLMYSTGVHFRPSQFATASSGRFTIQ